MLGHGDLAAIREDELWMAAEALDEAEGIIPAPAVESCRMRTQFVEDLMHLKGGGHCLYQHRGPDGTVGNAERLLSKHENLVPQARLQVTFHLGQIEIGGGAFINQSAGVMEEEQSEIEQTRRDRFFVEHYVLLRHVPAAWPDDERCGLVLEGVVLAFGARIFDGPTHRIPHIDLTIKHRFPGRA